MALVLTQPLRGISKTNITLGKRGRYIRLTTLLPSCTFFMNSGNLNFLDPSGPFQACNCIAFPILILSQQQYYPHNMFIQISPNSTHTLCCGKAFLSVIFINSVPSWSLHSCNKAQHTCVTAVGVVLSFCLPHWRPSSLRPPLSIY